MSNAYITIDNWFNKRIKDVMFSPKLLDELDDEERKKVEEKLIDCIFQGVKISYQYIKYLKTFNIDDVFTDEKMKELDERNRIIIYNELYKVTKDNKYLNILLDLAKTNYNAYSFLTFIYMSYEGDKVSLYQELEKLSNVSDVHKQMFQKRCTVDLDYTEHRI